MKKNTKFIMAVVIMLLIFPLTVSAAVGNKYRTGAELPQYENVVTVNVDPQEFDRSFMKALSEAGEKANGNTQYKIVVPPGTYTIGHQYRVPGNTYIYAKGARIEADGTRTIVLAGTNKKSENIMIEGGTWTTLKQEKGVIVGAPFRFMGVKNLILKDMDIQTNRPGHIIEVADIYGMTVQGCKISGNNLDAKEPYRNVQPKEAIQLDVATPAAMPNYDGAYNGKGCHRVLIKNNSFVNCARGIGSHSEKKGAEKVPYTYITVTGNTIKNLLGEGIHGENWRNCTISNNKISKTKQAGIYVRDAYNVRISKNKITDIRKYSGARKNFYDSKGIYGNGILIRTTKKLYVDRNRIHKVYKTGIKDEFCSGKKMIKNKITGVRK